MKILKLSAENVKKLVAVEITPSGETVIIAGKNGAGKTSVLDSIWWALAGTSNIQAQPIRKGETKARIRLDMGELIVERKFTEAGSTLIVENAEGARFPSPQKMLDALLGELSFDPLAFSRMDPRKQFDELRRVSELDVDIDALDLLTKGDYLKRTEINRDAKAKRAQAEGITVGAIAELIDEYALTAEMQRAGEVNTEIETRKARRVAAQAEANICKSNGVALRDRAAKTREEMNAIFKHATAEADAAYQRAKDAAAETLQRATQQADLDDKSASDALNKAGEIEKKIDGAEPLPQAIDVTALRQQVDVARETNIKITANISARDRKAAAITEAKALEAKAAELTASMEAREKVKADAIAKAKLPVDGLGFGAGIVTYGGIPFDQASSAEQLRVSLAIAMAANPKLRVIRIQDGSLLDDESMLAIAEAAKSNDYQIWIERVDTTGKVGIIIEDGMVKETAVSA